MKDDCFDFTLFRIIGTNQNFEDSDNNRNISKIEHWLYGQCNNDTKIFNSKEGSYYNNEKGFKWPVIAHGLLIKIYNYII